MAVASSGLESNLSGAEARSCAGEGQGRQELCQVRVPKPLPPVRELSHTEGEGGEGGMGGGDTTQEHPGVRASGSSDHTALLTS